MSRNRKNRLRLLAGLIAISVPAVGALTVVPVRADQQELQTVSEGSPIVDKEFPPILAADPVTITAGEPLNPPDCALSPTCHAIPVDIVVPELAEGDDFIVNASITFDAPSGAEDVDVYFWDDQQTAKARGSSGYTEVSSSASAANPEAISVFNPTLGRYNFAVNNFSGVAVTYRLSMSIKVVEFSTPFESLAPSANRGGGTTPPPGSSRPPSGPPAPITPDSSGSQGAFAPPPASPGAGPALSSSVVSTPSLATSDLPDDADFSAGRFADDAAFSDELAAPALPTPNDLAAFGQRSAPSATALLVWLVALPLVAIALAGGLLARRNPGLLRNIIPRRRPSSPAEA